MTRAQSEVMVKPDDTGREIAWHALSAGDLYARLTVLPDQGLSPSEAGERRARYGPNRIPVKKGKGPVILFLLQFHQPLVYILLVSTLITTLLGEWVDAGVIFGVVLVNAIIGFLQEMKAVRAIDSLARSLSTTATVLRDGTRRQVPAEDLVPGDVVFLQSGDKVPADLRLIAVRELQVDESALTGESVPVQKHPDPQPEDTPLADRHCMAYSSTLVTWGVGTGVVVATGSRTEIGKISELIESADMLETPLTRKIARFSSILLYVILALSAATFVIGVARGESWLLMFMAVVALAVGAIPEGLPAAVTITLAIGVARMAKRNAIIRKLPAVETLGSTTVICSDKTGTLTKNQMTVQLIVAGGVGYRVTGVGYDPEGAIVPEEGVETDPSRNRALQETLRAGLLCNDTSLVHTPDGWRVEGDPTEAALLVAAGKGGFDPGSVRQRFPRIDSIPFESHYQYMATLNRVDGANIIFMKGSMESVLSRCADEMLPAGERRPLDLEQWEREGIAMAAKGVRVLAFACREVPSLSSLTHEDVASGMTLLGLQGMIDPPRPEAIAAVAACHRAGIRVKMITGDHRVTAQAIAREIGLGEGRERTPSGLEGRELSRLDDDALRDAVGETVVFARVAPEQKLRLVEALQSRGEIVAMTGDGVNDAPALKQADIGIAMGMTGTEVARDAADMILTDDNFSSIEGAIEEGRGVYDNLVKFITWTLPTNLGEGLVIMAAVCAGVDLPILPVQILWINMTTAVLLGLTLAFEPKEPGIMERPPVDPKKPLLTRELALRILIVGVLLLIGSFGIFELMEQEGANIQQARTCAVNVFVFGELFYLFNCRSFRHSPFSLGFFGNRWLTGGVVIMIILQFVYTHAPLMNRLFGSHPLDGRQWGLVLLISFLIYPVIEIEKRLSSSVGG